MGSQRLLQAQQFAGGAPRARISAPEQLQFNGADQFADRLPYGSGGYAPPQFAANNRPHRLALRQEPLGGIGAPTPPLTPNGTPPQHHLAPHRADEW